MIINSVEEPTKNRKKINVQWLLLAVAISAVSLGVLSTLLYSAYEKNKQQTEKIAALENEKSGLESSLARLDESYQTLTAQHQDASNRLGKMDETLKNKDKELAKQSNLVAKQQTTVPFYVGQQRTYEPPPPVVEEKPAYTMNVLRGVLIGKTEEEVVKMLGKPNSIGGSGGTRYWYYKNVAYDSTTGLVARQTQVVFDGGTVDDVNF